MVQRLINEVLNFFENYDIDEYILVGTSIKDLRNTAEVLDGQPSGSYELCANGRISYDSQREAFTTKIERDKL